MLTGSEAEKLAARQAEAEIAGIEAATRLNNAYAAQKEAETRKFVAEFNLENTNADKF